MRTIIILLAFLASMLLVANGQSATIAGEREKLTYTVKAGDTWGDIAFALGVSMERLAIWNPDASVRSLRPGDSLSYYREILVEKTVDDAEVRSDLAAIKVAQEKIMQKIDEPKRVDDSAGGIKPTHVIVGSILVCLAGAGFYFFRRPRPVVQAKRKQDRQSAELEHSRSLIIGRESLTGSQPVNDEIPDDGETASIAAAEEVAQKVSIEVKLPEGRKGFYTPELSLDGRFISLHRSERTKELMTFADIRDLKSSVEKTFKRNPDIIQQEIDNGRLLLAA